MPAKTGFSCSAGRAILTPRTASSAISVKPIQLATSPKTRTAREPSAETASVVNDSSASASSVAVW